VNLTFKRLFIIFSVALNVGFIVTAIIVLVYHPIDPLERRLAYKEKALKGLNLNSDQENMMLAEIRSFHQKFDKTRQGFKVFRSRILSILAAPGPLDSQRIEAVGDEIQQRQDQIRQMAFHHVLTLRQQLGEENGARFFQALKKKVESERILP
jgi:hypothetical protein